MISKKLNNLKKSLGMMEGAIEPTSPVKPRDGTPDKSPDKLPPPSRGPSIRSIADKPKEKVKKAAPKLDAVKPAAASPKVESPKAKDSLKKKRLS